ncbi:diguanylate cyclase [Anaerotignum lactatifermentans]|uniref:Diguanylate cyclase n=1 Tax=Anaerotignum lactatifermentans TaxID=160404 RepID=A0ABS2GBT5_9FIRM|nr:diguanylate cyclase [Anaerotignum lactatifermentans]MBM6829574.1 diguanylate cyclase [Anaerotignum lactatifermentans]MBM6878068.1 diguanylate cyclase [Anaerotignum lactatifermentans]MBM6951102.1 diguanylate cyclase [Anaerotignum lactatifermentans]
MDKTLDSNQPNKLHKLFSHLNIPSFIRQEFYQESVRKNEFSLWFICAIIFVIEAFNMARVLLWSTSKLSSLNNRIYFGMYILLIVIGAIWLLVRRPLKRASALHQWAVQFSLTTLMLLWHLALNTYDLYRDPHAGTAVLTTALLALSLLIQAPFWCSILQHVIIYVLFLFIMAPLMDTGSILNMTISFVVAMSVSLAHAHHICIVLQQQKQIVQMNDTLRQLVQQDPLTGLLNRAAVEYRAEQLLQNSERARTATGLTLFMMDLDGFKEVNDRFGHPCGDFVLVETANTLRSVFTMAVGMGRIGGDEFSVLYDRPLTEETALALGNTLLKQLKDIHWQGHPMEIGCSIGICICTQPNYPYQQLYAETDQMLYQAKKNGKGRCCIRKLDTPAPEQTEQE